MNGKRTEYDERKGGKLMKKEVEEKGLRRWREGMERKSSLRYYRSKKKPGYERAYDGSIGGELLFKARSGSLEVNKRTERWNGGRSWCTSCLERGIRVDEDLEHVIVECPRYNRLRNNLEEEIIRKVGREVWENRKQEEDLGVAAVLGLENEYKEVVPYTKGFLRDVWRERVRGGADGGGRIGGVDHGYVVRGEG